jgi:spore coat associated protein JA (CotJA)
MNRRYDKEELNRLELAKAYVPFQKINQVYSSSEALKKGTLFPELYKPYMIYENSNSGGRYHG